MYVPGLVIYTDYTRKGESKRRNNMSNALKQYANEQKARKISTPQTEKAVEGQVKNSAGGYVFSVDEKSRLERFLILGTDGGTYYVGQPQLTKENIAFVKKMIASNEKLVLDTVVDVSTNGRAYKNTPAIFTMAMLLVEGSNKGATRSKVNSVVRTGTHLFEFANFLNDLGGWGRAKRGAVADWYTGKSADELAYQVIKYRQREGFTHRDLFRLSHPVGVEEAVGDFVLNKPVVPGHVSILDGFAQMQAAGSVKEVVSTLNEHKSLPWETIPTQFLKDVRVWKMLFANGQLNGQALVRNITRLARIGAFNDLVFAADYASRLVDEKMIERTKLHPINFLNALVVHETGQVARNNSMGYGWYGYGYGRNKDWNTSSVIVDALNDGFHTSFKTITPAGKRTLVGLDVSGSMGQNANGLDLSCAQVSAAMAMTIMRTERASMIRGFSTQFKDLGISSKMGLNQVMKRVSDNNFGGTDASLPMRWARKNKMEIDTFVVITDNETWAGRSHPFQELKKYRSEMGIDARLAVLGVAANDFTIADPSDRGMMDFVGFDANAPRVLADFSAGRL